MTPSVRVLYTSRHVLKTWSDIHPFQSSLLLPRNPEEPVLSEQIDGVDAAILVAQGGEIGSLL